jgi:hypothetical protein
MGLRDGEWAAVAFPHFGEPCLRTGLASEEIYADGFCIGVAVTSVPAPQVAGISVNVRV